MIVIDRQMAGGRLDKLLIKYFDQTGAGFVYKMLRKKNILLNGKKAAGNEILREEDTITLYLADDTIRRFHSDTPAPVFTDVPPVSSLIVFEDENLLAVSKPAGILSQQSAKDEISLNEMICSYLHSPEDAGLFTPGIANRLDRNTTGIVLTGKNPAAQRSLSQAVKNRELQKYYLCIVKGTVQGRDQLEGYLLKNKTQNKVQVFEKDAPHPEEALYIRTDYRALSNNGDKKQYGCSLLEVDLVTGRPHQIRAHLAFCNMPVIGDGKYGNKVCNDWFRRSYGVKDQLLHAGRISFCRMSGILEYLNGSQIEAPLPSLFRKVMEGEHLCLPGSHAD